MSAAAHTEDPSACTLALVVRRLTGHEMDLYDEIKRHFAGGDVVWCVDSPPGRCRMIRRAIERMPRGWKGGGDPHVWITALHAHMPDYHLEWIEKEIVQKIEWHGREGSPHGGRLALLRDALPEKTDNARNETLKKLWIASSVQPPRDWFCDGETWTFGYGRVQMAADGFEWAMRWNGHKRY